MDWSSGWELPSKRNAFPEYMARFKRGERRKPLLLQRTCGGGGPQMSKLINIDEKSIDVVGVIPTEGDPNEVKVFTPFDAEIEHKKIEVHKNQKNE
ncbi:hypothetical protein FQR65_LT09443 [Abscondita terminalis]|nr:hypothetical protein FQR65_LT09443 [Abscondita terminalis]